MDAIFEYNEWFATMSDNDCDHEEKGEPLPLVDYHGSSPPHKSRLLQRSSSFYDLEAGVIVLEIEDENDCEEDTSLTGTSVDSSEEDLSTSYSTQEDLFCHDDSTMTTRRRLTFNPKVKVREYNITIGDHPLCSDALPLSLDWSHAPDYCTGIEQSKSRGYCYQPPRILCLQDRRQRLVSVANYTVQALDTFFDCSAPIIATEVTLAKRILNRLQQSLFRVERRLLDAADAVWQQGEEEEEFNWSDELLNEEQDEDHKEYKDYFIIPREQNH